MEKLRIIDKGLSDENSWSLTIDYNEGQLSHESRLNKASITSVTHLLKWYYSEYLLRPFGHNYKKATELINSISDLGYSLVDKILSEEIKTLLADKDPKDLIISLESNDIQFLAHPWEILQLNQQPQPLSTSAFNFTRRLKEKQQNTVYLSCNENEPLHLLFINPKPIDITEHPFTTPATPMYQAMSELAINGSIELTHAELNQLEQLTLYLETLKNTKKILIYFNGYVIDSKEHPGQGSIIFENEDGSSNPVSYTEFSAILRKYELPIILLDIAPVFDEKNNSNAISPSLPLSLLNAGIGNVVSVLYANFSIYAQRFYSLLLSNLAAANSIGQAVVNTRAVLRAHTEQSVLTVQALDYHDWILINHYSSYDSILFEKALELKSLNEDPKYQERTNNLIGFNQELLQKGFLGRVHEKRTIDRAFKAKNLIHLKGDSGIGKTHLTHHYALINTLDQKFKKALYFNFNDNSYTIESLIQIIANLLAKPQADGEYVKTQLLENPFLFIFDNLRADTIKDKPKVFFGFINDISHGESKVILISDDDIIEYLGSYEQLSLPGLNPYDSRQFACSVLKQLNLEDAEEIPNYFDFLESIKGNPFIIKTLLPYLEEKDINQIQSKYQDFLNKIPSNNQTHADSNQAITALFEYGWNQASVESQKILLAFKENKAYLTDGLIVAFDKKTNHKIKEEFYAILSIKNSFSMAKAFNDACKIGLYQKKTFGYVVHPYAATFLSNKKIHPLDSINEAYLNATLSKIYLLELNMIHAFVNKHQEKEMYQIILSNQSRWFNALKILWKEQVFSTFMTDCQTLENLLSYLGLGANFHLWALNTLQEFNPSYEGCIDNIPKSKAWLQLAYYALEVPESFKLEMIKQKAHFWEEYLKGEVKAALFDNILMFLESYYKKKGDWSSRKTLSQKASQFYQSKNNYDKVITSLRSQARCEEALGNLDSAIKLEEYIINEIPYERLQPGAEHETLLSLAMNRVARDEFNQAKELLSKVKKLPHPEPYQFHIDSIEANILFKQGNFSKSLRHYSSLWAKIYQGKMRPNPQIQSMITNRLKAIAQNIGEHEFNQIFKEVAPNIKTPMELENEKNNSVSND